MVAERDLPLLEDGGAFARQLARAREAGAYGAVIAVGRAAGARAAHRDGRGQRKRRADGRPPRSPRRPSSSTRSRAVGVKMLLNALSTCTMVRLGRVLGNRMIWVVPSNLKLVDRSTRYIRDLAGVSYEDACRTLFEVIEYVEPRRRAGRAYPAPVGVATMRLRHGLSLEEAEARLVEELA